MSKLGNTPMVFNFILTFLELLLVLFLERWLEVGGKGRHYTS